MILYQDCSSHLDSSKNMSARGRGLFSLYIYIENFKTLLVKTHWTDFNIILQKCSFGNSLPRLFKEFGFVKKHGRRGLGGGGGWVGVGVGVGWGGWGGGLFSLYIYIYNGSKYLVLKYLISSGKKIYFFLITFPSSNVMLNTASLIRL